MGDLFPVIMMLLVTLPLLMLIGLAVSFIAYVNRKTGIFYFGGFLFVSALLMLLFVVRELCKD